MKKDIVVTWQTGQVEPNGRLLIVSINTSDGRHFTDVAKPDELGWMDIHGNIHLYNNEIVAWAELPKPLIVRP